MFSCRLVLLVCTSSSRHNNSTTAVVIHIIAGTGTKLLLASCYLRIDVYIIPASTQQSEALQVLASTGMYTTRTQEVPVPAAGCAVAIVPAASLQQP